MKGQGVPTFRQCVEARYQHDLVMRGTTSFVVMLLPLAVLLIVFILSGTDTKYSVLSDYMPKAVVLCLAFEAYLIMIITYSLYSRQISHSKRDKKWMESLIAYARSKGADTSKPEKTYREVLRKESFRLRPIAVILLAMMLLFIIWAVVKVVPGIDEFSDVELSLPTVIWGFFLLFMMVVFVFLPTLTFPAKHEKRQMLFTAQLANALYRRDIEILPMGKVSRRVPGFLAVMLIFFTFGYGFIFLIFRVFRDMNNHLMNQWEYENELLKAIDSEGGCGFDEGLYQKSPENARDGRRHSRSARRFSGYLRREVRNVHSLPRILYLAEIFLLVLLANFMLKLIAITCVISEDPDSFVLGSGMTFDSFVILVVAVMDVFFMMTMVGSIMGLASRKASSWRKVVRSCVTFVLPLWISLIITRDYTLFHLFDFNVFATTLLLAGMLLIMLLSPTVKSFYTPFGYDVPPTQSWVKYAVWGNIVPETNAGTAFADDAFDGTDYGSQ